MSIGFGTTQPTRIALVTEGTGGPTGFTSTSKSEPQNQPEAKCERAFNTSLRTRVEVGSTVQNSRGRFGRRGLVAPLDITGR